MTRRPHLLILGGTGEGRALAAAAAARFGARLRVTTALAGRTRDPAPLAGEVRSGGFGGAAGLARFLSRAQVGALIDATHPFAAAISANAAVAAAAARVPRLVLRRAAWRRRAGDRWSSVADAPAAAAALAAFGPGVFLALGAKDLDAFAALRGRRFLVRLVERPAEGLPLARARLVLARGPFDLAGEIALLRRHRIDVVVCKASGGEATRAKLDAARALGLPVVMIRRPKPPPGRAVATPAAAIAWARHALSLDDGARGSE